MPELGRYGSVRGARGNSRPYRESERLTVKTALMTHFGYRQQFSEPCDLTAWGKHQSERSQRL